VRLRFLDVPLSVDEGGYAAIARFWARGGHLYRDVWVDRPQGLLLLYRGAEGLLGPNVLAVRLLATLWAAGIVSVLALLVARLSTQRIGLLAAGLFAILSVGPRLEGFAANGELLAALPSVAALCAFTPWLLGRGRTWSPLAAGALAACAVLVKQSGYDAGGAIVLWLAAAAAAGWRPRREALRALGLVVAGACVPVALAVAHGALVGLHAWWFAVVDYRLSVESVATGSTSLKLTLLWESFRTAWPCLVPLLVLSPIGAVAAWRRSRELRLLVLWSALALTAFALGGLFHPHYYVGLIAPLSALAAIGADAIARRLGRSRARLVLAATFVPVLIAALPAYDASSPAAVSWRTSHDSRILTDKQVGAWLKAHTTPDQTIYALYADASLYYAADRRWPYRYLWYLGVQHIPGALGELERVLAGPSAPRYVAIYQQPGMIDKTGTVQRILDRRYRPAATVDGVRILGLR
jgi:4-amino-4-deoxy-L-arabinose transferase-like glycosyltransferase